MPRSPKADAATPEKLRAFSRSLPMALLRARGAVMSRFRPFLREHDLTEQQWRVLRALTDADAPLRAGEIARATFISLPSLSRLLRTLETRELVKRSAHADDLRAAQVTLSNAGRRLVARLAPLSEARYAEIATAVGADDLERLYALLGEVIERLAPATDDEPTDAA